jgi:hypothetical protein
MYIHVSESFMARAKSLNTDLFWHCEHTLVYISKSTFVYLNPTSDTLGCKPKRLHQADNVAEHFHTGTGKLLGPFRPFDCLIHLHPFATEAFRAALSHRSPELSGKKT